MGRFGCLLRAIGVGGAGWRLLDFVFVDALPGFAGGGVFGVPDVVFAGGDLFDGAAGDDAVGCLFGDGRVGCRALEVVVLLDEEPVGLALVARTCRSCG